MVSGFVLGWDPLDFCWPRRYRHGTTFSEPKRSSPPGERQENLRTVFVGRYPELAFGTFGELSIANHQFKCKTVERPWLNNKKLVSCIPIGTYTAKWEYSPKFKMHLWELKGVPGRDETKFHAANTYMDLEGCIGVGDAFGVSGTTWAVLNSRATLEKFHEVLKDEQEIRVAIHYLYKKA